MAIKSERGNYIWPELSECTCVKKNNVIYFFPMNFNALCKIDLETGIVETTASVSKEYFDKRTLFVDILQCNDEIVCIPYSAKKIHAIDLVSETEKDQIADQDDDLSRESYYHSVYANNRDLYLFPFIGKKLLKVDLEQKRVVKTVNLKQKFNQFWGKEYDFFSASGCYAFENKIYMVMNGVGVIAEYDISEEEMYFYRLNGSSSYYVHLTGYENNVYIMGDAGEIHIWDIRTHSQITTQEVSLAEGEAARFRKSVRFEKYIYIFRYIPANEFIRIDTETNQIDVVSIKEMYGLDDLMEFVIMEDAKCYFLSSKKEMYIIDFIEKEIKKMQLSLNIKKMNELITSHLDELNGEIDELIYEGNYIWTLENYIKKCKSALDDQSECYRKNIGALIHDNSIKECV